jgi:hypothetical protein
MLASGRAPRQVSGARPDNVVAGDPCRAGLAKPPCPGCARVVRQFRHCRAGRAGRRVADALLVLWRPWCGRNRVKGRRPPLGLGAPPGCARRPARTAARWPGTARRRLSGPRRCWRGCAIPPDSSGNGRLRRSAPRLLRAAPKPDAIAQRQTAVGTGSSVSSGRLPKAVEHGPATPAAQQHQVAPGPPPTRPRRSAGRRVAGVGDRMVPVAVVYTRSGAALTCVSARRS